MPRGVGVRVSSSSLSIAEIAQLVEHNLAKVGVASSSLVFRSMLAQVAELVDAHVSGACVERRAGSTPVLGTDSRGSVLNTEPLFILRHIQRIANPQRQEREATDTIGRNPLTRTTHMTPIIFLSPRRDTLDQTHTI